jgi:hypothetical protein
MQETYTFSRALHLMRYGGKKMRPITDTDDYCIIVKNNQLVGCYDGMETVVIDEDNMPSWFTPKDIMGSWVEVK